MDYAVFAFGPHDFPALLEPVVDVYREAFSPPPYEKGEGEVIAFASLLTAHTERPGFCGFWASDAAGSMIGFVYGFSGAPGQFWHDVVSQALEPALVERWLVDYFTLVQLAVCPRYQGRGIGTQLHDTILGCTQHATAALTTAQQETPALRLYRRRGWRTIHENLFFPGDSTPMRVMAVDLLPRAGE